MHDTHVHNFFISIILTTYPIFNMDKVHIRMLYKSLFTTFMHVNISHDSFKLHQIVQASRPHISSY
jgi:hypothetical protein